LPREVQRVSKTPAPSILLISNGHGEDLNAAWIAAQLRLLHPSLRLAALPIVGPGTAYVRRGIELLYQGRALPSGGMVYQGNNIWRDLRAGWVQQTLRQLLVAWRHGRRFDLVLSVGDHVPLIFALLTGRPTVVFLVSTSSYYEGRLRLAAFTRWFCQRPRTLRVLTRDAFTAEDLRDQGMVKACFRGYPIMDFTRPGRDVSLARDPAMTTLALLPGSRFPEAQQNLVLMLQLCAQLHRLAADRQWRFLAAGVEGIQEEPLPTLLMEEGWQRRDGVLSTGEGVEVHLMINAFGAVISVADLVIGMAGTAVEQAVGMGLPVVQIIGRGPQFSYAFAESQMRLLGPAVHTVGTGPAGPRELRQAAVLILRLLDDPDLRAKCVQVGRERVGPPGGSERIARTVLDGLASIRERAGSAVR
jgi:uncharacterized protein (TIGR03492 family)